MSLRDAQQPSTPPRGTRGFALVLTLGLLALLVLVMAGLAIYARIETRAVDNSTRHVQARRNALMALDVALAELQRQAGPDARISATAESLTNSVDGAKFYTGIWDANASGATPMTWLVSGVDGSGARISPRTSQDSTFVELVGANTAGMAGAVRAKRVEIRNPLTGEIEGGHAWWVGDEGVKASIGLPERQQEVALWDTAGRHGRLRQQIAGTPNYFRNTVGTEIGFDPQSNLTRNLISREQFGNLTGVSAEASRGLPEFLRQHTFDFTHVASSVLANTRSDARRGLLRDLSLAPGELGAAFVAYTNFENYMEAPSSSNSAIPAIADASSPRRRYRMTPPVETPSANGLPGVTFSVAPVLTEFLLQFGLDRTVANQAYVKARAYVGLWNPYTSALVPPSQQGDLALEVTGLPSIVPVNFQGVAGPAIDLQSTRPAMIAGSNGSVNLELRFSSSTSGSDSDKASWLPGRLYFWTTPTGSSPAGELTFYNKNLNAQGWAYPQFSLPGGASNTTFGISGPAVADLTLTLKSRGEILAIYRVPSFQAVSQQINTFTWKIGYSFRMTQPSSLDSSRSWLRAFDVRASSPSADFFGPFDPNLPARDPSTFNAQAAPITSQHLNQYLIYRVTGTTASGRLTSVSANNDVPLFELPRQPLLSLGQLQHLQLTGRRPFSIGNSWGADANALFDLFFFSGLSATGVGPDITAGQPLPNWNLAVVDSRLTRAASLSLSDLRDGGNPHSSRFLMQSGGFNVNSVRNAAWRAVLSSLRFSADEPFRRADINNVSGSPNLGSQNGATMVSELFHDDVTLGETHSSPAVLRFPQSAQETYYWEPGTTLHAQQLSTQSFRMGVRGQNEGVKEPSLPTNAQYHSLSTDQLEELGAQIADLIKTRQEQRGPFRTMEEFLSAHADFGGVSLIERAIANIGLNAPGLSFDNAPSDANGIYTAPGFSSLSLSQADLLNALAPYLKTRSDTFVIRTYGEHVNPATGRVESRAWLEATVQRTPTPFATGDDFAQPSLTGLGRRFQVISFRWLNETDI